MSLLEQLHEAIPPIQRLLVFDQSLLAKCNESSSLAELTQHILYYRNARQDADENDKDDPGTHSNPHGHYYAQESVLQFSSLCLTLLALPKELTPGSERTPQDDEPPDDPAGMVYFNTCTLVFCPLVEESPNHSLMAVVQLERQPGVRDSDGTLAAKWGTRTLVQRILERIHTMWHLLHGGEIRIRWQEVWNHQCENGSSSSSSSLWQESEAYQMLRKNMKDHYDFYLNECFLRGRTKRENKRWGPKRIRTSLPLLALQALKRLEERNGVPLKVPNGLKPYLVGTVEPDSLEFPFPRECKGISCFYQGRHVHFKGFGRDHFFSSSACRMEEEQMQVLLDYFTLCDEDSTKRKRGSYFIPYSSEPNTSKQHRTPFHSQSLNHEYEWEGSLRSVHAPLVSLRVESEWIQTFFATLLVSGDFGFLFLLQLEEKDCNGCNGETGGSTDGINAMQQRLGECSKLLHEFMSDM